MATTAINTLRFARRSKDTGVPAAQAETMAEPVFTPVGAVVRLRLGRSRRARGRRPPSRGAQPRARRGNRSDEPCWSGRSEEINAPECAEILRLGEWHVRQADQFHGPTEGLRGVWVCSAA